MFVLQKLDELKILATALNKGRVQVQEALVANNAAIQKRRTSPRVHNSEVKAAVTNIDTAMGKRSSTYAQRAAKQAALLKLPAYPTTTIGSFPQTAAIRHARSEFKAGRLDAEGYRAAMQAEIARSIREQHSRAGNARAECAGARRSGAK